MSVMLCNVSWVRIWIITIRSGGGGIRFVGQYKRAMPVRDGRNTAASTSSASIWCNPLRPTSGGAGGRIDAHVPRVICMRHTRRGLGGDDMRSMDVDLA